MEIQDQIQGKGVTDAGPFKGNELTLTSLSSGPIGTAAATVDKFTFINFTLSGAGQTLTIPTPTDATRGHFLCLTNVDSANTCTILGKVVTRSGATPGTATIVCVWNTVAAAWTSNI